MVAPRLRHDQDQKQVFRGDIDAACGGISIWKERTAAASFATTCQQSPVVLGSHQGCLVAMRCCYNLL